MKELTVIRETYTSESTTGKLLWDGEFVCYTLEPRADASQGKPYCIPEGRYAVTLGWSNKRGCVVPCVCKVPGFSNIEIHMGNYPKDTEGCLLVGIGVYDDFVSGSRVAFEELMRLLFESGVNTWPIVTFITYERKPV